MRLKSWSWFFNCFWVIMWLYRECTVCCECEQEGASVELHASPGWRHFHCDMWCFLAFADASVDSGASSWDGCMKWLWWGYTPHPQDFGFYNPLHNHQAAVLNTAHMKRDPFCMMFFSVRGAQWTIRTGCQGTIAIPRINQPFSTTGQHFQANFSTILSWGFMKTCFFHQNMKQSRAAGWCILLTWHLANAGGEEVLYL